MARQTAAFSTEKDAMAMVLLEEEARGRTIDLLSKAQEREHGCDFLSELDNEIEYVEVKGWGEPLVADGEFTYLGDMNAQQHEAAVRLGDKFRLEFVGNLTAARTGTGDAQRLTLLGSEIAANAQPIRYSVELSSFVDRVRPATTTARET